MNHRIHILIIYFSIVSINANCQNNENLINLTSGNSWEVFITKIEGPVEVLNQTKEVYLTDSNAIKEFISQISIDTSINVIPAAYWNYDLKILNKRKEVLNIWYNSKYNCGSINDEWFNLDYEVFEQFIRKARKLKRHVWEESNQIKAIRIDSAQVEHYGIMCLSYGQDWKLYPGYLELKFTVPFNELNNMLDTATKITESLENKYTNSFVIEQDTSFFDSKTRMWVFIYKIYCKKDFAEVLETTNINSVWTPVSNVRFVFYYARKKDFNSFKKKVK